MIILAERILGQADIPKKHFYALRTQLTHQEPRVVDVGPGRLV